MYTPIFLIIFEAPEDLIAQAKEKSFVKLRTTSANISYPS